MDYSIRAGTGLRFGNRNHSRIAGSRAQKPKASRNMQRAATASPASQPGVPSGGSWPVAETLGFTIVVGAASYVTAHLIYRLYHMVINMAKMKADVKDIKAGMHKIADKLGV